MPAARWPERPPPAAGFTIARNWAFIGAGAPAMRRRP